MEYRNNWPVYTQEKVKPVKGTSETLVSSGVCVGGSSDSGVTKLDVALARAECNRKAKPKVLPLDVLMGKLISLQHSSDQNKACMARKAAAELAAVRKRLAFKCSLLKKQGKDTHIVMAIENRKALASFKARWANLLGDVV